LSCAHGAPDTARRNDGAVNDLATTPEAALKPLRPHVQMVFQDPFSSLNPRMSVGQIVGEPSSFTDWQAAPNSTPASSTS
jgi:ABC-type microcin C transport system duplicated ATPase subunit YejF